jgi:hypothetical protein
MAKTPPSSTADVIARLKKDMADLSALASVGSAVRARKSIDAEIRDVMAELGKILQEIDPVRQPAAVFDPSNPKVIGRIIALALVAQERVALASVKKFYGSGVYAIYYRGDFSPYAPLSGTETPIYVGQAAPKFGNARTPIDQGPQIADRLSTHCSNIRKAASTIAVGDFECRALVVQSGWESPAEDYLIHLFRPIWNNETNILYGIGKHGDAAVTRANKRSPWDTLHPGRQWAGASQLVDAKSPTQIAEELDEHFKTCHIFSSVDDVLKNFIGELRQI